MEGASRTRTRVLIVRGGKPAEHEVSLVSALSVAHALDRERFATLIELALERHGKRKQLCVEFPI